MPTTKLKRKLLGCVALFGLVILAVVLVIGGLWTMRLSSRAEDDFPPLGRFVQVDGAELHYVDRGTGRPVVFLHGAFGALQDFTATIFDPAAHRYRAIAFDRPGHGYSRPPPHECVTPAAQARLIHAALRELGVERPVLVGYSWAGSLVLSYALEFPDDVAGVVTLNGVLHSWPGTTSFVYDIPSIPIAGWIFTHTLVMPFGRYMSDKSVERAFDPVRPPLLFKSSPLPLTLRPGNFAANAAEVRCLDAFNQQQEKRYGELHLPIVIVVGEDDKVATPRLHSHALHDEVASSELVSLEGVGHQILYTRPTEVLRAIDRVWEMVDRAK